MTATAQGSTMRCDRAGCTNRATVEKDAWAFCIDHAGTLTTGKPNRPAPATSIAGVPMVVRDLGNGATQTLPAAAVTPPATGGIGLLLEEASAHSNKRVRNLAEKIETHLDDLRNRISDLAEDEKRKKAEAAAKEKARQDIARLEQQLAAAKAQLRGKPKATATNGTAGAQELPCRNGCGRTYASPQGRGKHERSCTAVSS